MKTSITLFIFLFAGISIGFIGCEDVSQNAEKVKLVPDQFVFEEQTYELGWGFLFDWEHTLDDHHSFSLEFYQKPEDMSQEADSIFSIYSIWFFGKAAGDDAIPESGIYTFSEEGSDAGYIDGGSLIFWKDEDGKEIPLIKGFKITSGQVEISKYEEVYVVEFDVKTEDGVEVTGSFSDELGQYYLSDYLDSKKSWIQQRAVNSIVEIK